MADPIGALRVMLDANAAQFDKDMGAARRSVSRFESSAGRNMEKFSTRTRRSAAVVDKSMMGLHRTIGLVSVALAGLFSVRTFQSFVGVSQQIEQLHIQMKFLTDTTDEAAAATETLVKFAGRVPFELGEIQKSAGSLLVANKNVKDLGVVLEITADIAAATGLSFQQTGEQLARAFSAGIASADLFRERGVNAMLGFQAGVSVSGKETAARITQMWKENTATMVGAAKDAAGTWSGIMSMISDKWLLFRNAVMGSGLFEFLKQALATFNEQLERNWGQIEAAAKQLGRSIILILPDLKKLASGIANMLPDLLKLAARFVDIANAAGKVFHIFNRTEIDDVTEIMANLNAELKDLRTGLKFLEDRGNTKESVLEKRREEIAQLEDKLRRYGATLGRLTARERKYIDILAKGTASTKKRVAVQTELNEQKKIAIDLLYDQNLQDEEFETIDEFTKKMEKLAAGLEKTAKAAEAVRAKARKDLQRDQEKTAAEFARPFRNAMDSIQDSIADNIALALDRGIDSFEDFADTVKRIGIRMAAEMAALMIFRPQVSLAGIAGGMGIGGTPLGPPGGGALNAAGGGFSGLSGLASLASFSGLSASALAASAMSGIENLALWAGFNPGSAFSAGMFAGQGVQNLLNPWSLGAGLVGGIGTHLLLQGGRTDSQNTNAQIGSAALGLAGGFAFGPLGAGVGAAAGNFLGGLFGSSKKNTGAKTSSETQGSFRDAATNIFAALGVPVGRASEISNLARNFGEAGVPGSNLKETFNIGVVQRIRAFSDEFGNLGDVLDRIDFTQTAQAIDDVRFAARLLDEDFGLVEKEITQAEQLLGTLADAYEAANAQAKRLGLSTEKLTAAYHRAVEGVTDEFDDAIELAILQITDPAQAAMDALVAAQDARLKEAKALGADLVDVERLNMLERKALIEAGGSDVQDFLAGLFRDPKIVAPMEALANAWEQFNAALAAGDSSVTTIAGDLINLLRGAFASGPGFHQGVGMITEGLRGFATGGRFRVGGTGGPDSQLVQFMASPNEDVSISPAAQAELSSEGQTGLLNALLGEMRGLRELMERQGFDMRVQGALGASV